MIMMMPMPMGGTLSRDFYRNGAGFGGRAEALRGRTLWVRACGACAPILNAQVRPSPAVAPILSWADCEHTD